ncbi:MAG TPA: isocitrate/isopropylmalate family dehydrogenase [Polyangiaceae bacterium]|jgi:3-isopropylmalate dehydrogenase
MNVAGPASLRREPLRVAAVGGDGIGPEVTRAGVRLLERLAGDRLEIVSMDGSADRFLAEGVAISDVEWSLLGRCGGLLLGAFGDPRVPDHAHAEAWVLDLRRRLELYANLRPIKPLHDALVPLRNVRARDIDVLIVRENTEGAYSGIGWQRARDTSEEVAVVEDRITRRGVERVLAAGFALARERRRRLHLADKSNAMRAHDLWRRVFDALRAEYADVEATAMYIDALCYELVHEPAQFDVVVTGNLFGDIASDVGAALQGGLGVSPSACKKLDHPGHVAVFEPVHGSAPELSGLGRANPFASMLSAAMLLEHLGMPDAVARVRASMTRAVEARQTTPDLGGKLDTAEAAEAVLERLQG